ncbi:hypothetical protein ABID19_006921, partial [Mesorhizobium robiniae]
MDIGIQCDLRQAVHSSYESDIAMPTLSPQQVLNHLDRNTYW